MAKYCLLAIFLSTILVHVLSCPEKCSCNTDSSGYRVDCYRATLGYIPTELPNDTFYINLPSNNLIALDVPICQLFPELTYLNLEGNRISEIPRQALEGCEKLQTLNLRYNAIYMFVEGSLPYLSSLDFLYLWGNKLHELNVSFCQSMPTLKTLDLGYNGISEIPHDYFVECDQLQTLQLSGNRLNKIDNAMITNMTKLQNLQLDRNAISFIHPDAFQSLPSLNYLYLYSNPLSENGYSFIRSCPGVFYLDLQYTRKNDQHEFIQKYDLLLSSNLHKLYLQNNRISHIDVEIFEGTTNLNYLNFDNNRLVLNESLCRFLPKLETVYLRYNQIFEVSSVDFSECGNLQILYLVGNQIVNIHWDAFRNLNSLRSLDIHSNQISVLPNDSFSENNTLEYLDLDNNEITYIHWDAFKNLQSLHSLDLSSNKIATIHRDAFKDLFSLHTLQMTFNGLTMIDSFIFANTARLGYLYLDNNPIYDIHEKAFWNLTSLRSLSISNNRLTSIDQLTFANTTQLNSLNLNGNNISIIHQDAFANLQSLNYLYLSSNPLSKNGYGFLPHLKSIDRLYLANTRSNEMHPSITKEDIEPLKYMRYLYFSNNEVTDLDPVLFHQLPSIYYLNLQNNMISTIKQNTFRYLNNIHTINLQNNNISQIEQDAFGENRNLRNLYLWGNPLKCDCSIVPFWKWLTARATSLGSSAQCSNGTYVNKIPPQEVYHCNTSIPVIEAYLMEGDMLTRIDDKYRDYPSLILVFKCRSGDVLNGTYLFDIYWYINGNLVVSHENVSFETITSTELKEADWIANYHLNMEVQCAIRMRSIDDYTPGGFIYSRIYHAGLIPEKLEYTVLEGESINITFTPTVPVGCNSSHKDFHSQCYQNFYIVQPNYDTESVTCMNDVSNKYILFEIGFCGIRITMSNWKEQKSLTVFGYNDGIYNYKGRTAHIRLVTPHTSSGSKMWTHFSIPDIKLTIVDKDTLLVNRLCQIHNDPHIRTFDGRIYDYMEVGEYIMYRNDKGPYMVNVLFTTCGAGSTGPSCNCGVAIRSRNSLFVFRTCQTISKSKIHNLQQPVIRHYSCDENDMFIEQSKNSYKIRLPHGTEIKFSRYKWSRFVSGISIKPSVFDLDDSRGLCGVPNTYKDQWDDFTHRQNGVIYDWKSFGDSWRVMPDMTADQLFVEDPEFFELGNGLMNEEDSTLRHYCACENEASSTEGIDEFYTLHCNLTDTTDFCSENKNELNPFYTDCSDSVFIRRRRSVYSTHTIHRRSTTDSDDVVDFLPLNYDADAFATDKEDPPTFRNDWTYEKAYNICLESIERELPANLYQELVEVPQDYFISSCVKDIELTANTTYLQDTIGAMTTFLVTELVRNESLYNQTTAGGKKTLLEYITSRLCPNNCSGNGICSSGICTCEGAYLGVDCSEDISTPPLHISLPDNGLCTLGNRTCKRTNIFGDFSSSTLWCKLKHFQIFENDMAYTSDDCTVLAEYRNMFMVTVPLPNSRKKRSAIGKVLAEGFDISLSNDGENFGDSVKLIIFNEACYTCDSKSINCTDLGTCNVPDDSSSPESREASDFTMIGIASGFAAAVLAVFVTGIYCFKCKKKDQRTKVDVYSEQAMYNIAPPVQQWTSKKFWMSRESTTSDLHLDFANRTHQYPEVTKYQHEPVSYSQNFKQNDDTEYDD